MEIFNYFECDKQEKWLSQIEQCDWSAAKFLAQLLKENRFAEVCGEGALLCIMAEGEELAAFASLAPKDCIDDPRLTPWIGFVFTVPQYRGNRLSEKIISHLCAVAKAQGHEKVYICTDHVGLYEKYGFVYIENRIDVWGTDSRMYYKQL